MAAADRRFPAGDGRPDGLEPSAGAGASPTVDDELFRTDRDHPGPACPAPWPAGSQLVVAFLGGPVAATVIALANARRLELARERRRRALAVGVAGVALVAGLALVLADGDVTPGSTSSRTLSLLVVLVGLVVGLVQRHLQEPADRAHRSRGGVYASAWVPGVVAVVGGGLVQGGVVVAALALV